MARAIRIHAPGGPDALVVTDVDVPPPGPTEVRIRQTFCGVNFIDTYHRSGLYPLPSMPHGIGVEAAGTIDAIGDMVGGLRLGDRVAYAGSTPGAYAELRNVPADRVVRLPDGVSDETAAAALLQGMTAEYLVQRVAHLSAGDFALVHAAAGGTGTLLCQWLASLGVHVIGTVGTHEKAEIARSHGATHTIVYTREDFVARTREITDGAGVAVVYDAVGRDTFAPSLECLKKRGLMVSFGNASGAPAPFDVLELSRKGSLFLTRPLLFDYIESREELRASAKAVFDRVLSGVLRVEVTQRFWLAEAEEAHRALESRATTGKLLLTL